MQLVFVRFVTVSSKWISPVRNLRRWCIDQGYITDYTYMWNREGKYGFSAELTQDQIDTLIIKQVASGFADDIQIVYK